jgi:FAD/FMN-containing dehydrogenase
MKIARRTVIQTAAAATVMPALDNSARAVARTMHRVRPKDPDWPAPTVWDELNRATTGNLIKVQPLLAACQDNPNSDACAAVLKELKNPYYIGEQAAGTQSSGWIDNWRSSPSVYAIAAHTTSDVVAGVNFARTHRLRLVIKGGGHSYLGGSNAPDSLLIWMRPMDAVTQHDSFVGQGCEGRQAAMPAVSVQTGARWLPVYTAVTTQAGRYVQGGGCATVGVAGLVLGGGFGSFSKTYGMAGAGLLEAEVVTADGNVRIANACTNPDLFWALKGGGAGGLGAVTRLTLRTRTLPQFCGGVFGAIKAKSDAAFRRLIVFWTDFYAVHLFNLHWGESIVFHPDNTLNIGLVFHDLDQAQAEAAFKPFIDFITGTPADFTLTEPLKIVAIPAQRWWDVDYLNKSLPGMMVRDPRPGAPSANAWYQTNEGEVGFFLNGYEGAWLPVTLLAKSRRPSLNEALYSATRHWRVALHYNKGLAGAPPEELAAARNTAMNPAVSEAFTYAIIARGDRPAYPGMPGPGPDLALARRNAAAIARAMGVLRELVPDAGSYVSEAGYADPDWRRRCFGANYSRLLAVKRRYDPDGLFFTHHGVGSEEWSADGFTRL